MVKTVMLIDDDTDDSELFSEALRELSDALHFIWAKDGCEALELLNNEAILPDIIFLDINMPRKNGWECLLEIRANNNYNNIPVIMYSTSGSLSDKKKSILLGAKAFISKPNTFNELKKILKKVLAF